MTTKILFGIFLTSLLGSWHCAGMCGPFGFFLAKSKNKTLSQITYHFGRLTTYLSLALVFHLLGDTIRWTRSPWVFAVLMVAWAALLIFNFDWQPIKLPGWLIKLNQKVLGSKSPASGFILGATTTLLPCIWLYGFLVMSSTQAELTQALAVMGVFWLGTLPALILSHNLLFKADKGLRKKSRHLSTALILAMGIWVAWSHKPTAEATNDTGGGHPPGCPFHHSSSNSGSTH